MRKDETRYKVVEMLLGRGYSLANPETLRKAVDDVCDVIDHDCATAAERAERAAADAAAKATETESADGGDAGAPGNPEADGKST